MCSFSHKELQKNHVLFVEEFFMKLNAQRVSAIFTPRDHSFGQSNSFHSTHSFQTPPNRYSLSSKFSSQQQKLQPQQQLQGSDHYINHYGAPQSECRQSPAGGHKSNNMFRPALDLFHTPPHFPTPPSSFNTQSCQTDDLNAKSVSSELPNSNFREKSKMYTF